jgi:hypothetical protein
LWRSAGLVPQSTLQGGDHPSDLVDQSFRLAERFGGQPADMLTDQELGVSSASEPCAIARKLIFSRHVSRTQPSATLLGIEVAARVNWLRMPKRSSGGRRRDSTTISPARRMALVHRMLCR